MSMLALFNYLFLIRYYYLLLGLMNYHKHVVFMIKCLFFSSLMSGWQSSKKTEECNEFWHFFKIQENREGAEQKRGRELLNRSKAIKGKKQPILILLIISLG